MVTRFDQLSLDAGEFFSEGSCSSSSKSAGIVSW